MSNYLSELFGTLLFFVVFLNFRHFFFSLTIKKHFSQENQITFIVLPLCTFINVFLTRKYVCLYVCIYVCISKYFFFQQHKNCQSD